MRDSRCTSTSARGRRATALGLAALFAAAAVATTTACGSGTDSAAGTTGTTGPKKTAATAPASGEALEGKAYGYNPYAWATRKSSTIGIYGITLHGQSFSLGGQVKMVLYKDSGPRGIPVWYKTATAHSVAGRPGGGFDVVTGLLDCTAYGYAKDATLMVLDVNTNTWSNKVRVSRGCVN
jgi:hypothetical protein